MKRIRINILLVLTILIAAIAAISLSASSPATASAQSSAQSSAQKLNCSGRYCYGPKGSCHVRVKGHRYAGYKEYKKTRSGKIRPTGRCVLQ